MTGGIVQQWRRISMHPLLLPFTEWRIHSKWKRAGRPIPAPPLVKQHIVKSYQRRFNLDTFIETGTFTGEMVHAVRNLFRRIVSIELDDELFNRARQRFEGLSHITILHGDSGRLLPGVLSALTRPALFWLDGHFTIPGTARGEKDTPVVAEVQHLLARWIAGHVVLVDDARFFTGQDGYPTIDELRRWILARQPQAVVECHDDIIRWHDPVL